MGKCLKRINLKKRFFWKYFIVSLLLMIIACLMTKLFGHHMYNMTSHFFNPTKQEYDMGVAGSMLLWKLFIIQFTLAPAIALCWLSHHKEYKNECDNDYERRGKWEN